jgi:hypothetical protein
LQLESIRHAKADIEAMAQGPCRALYAVASYPVKVGWKAAAGLAVSLKHLLWHDASGSEGGVKSHGSMGLADYEDVPAIPWLQPKRAEIERCQDIDAGKDRAYMWGSGTTRHIYNIASYAAGRICYLLLNHFSSHLDEVYMTAGMRQLPEVVIYIIHAAVHATLFRVQL